MRAIDSAEAKPGARSRTRQLRDVCTALHRNRRRASRLHFALRCRRAVDPVAEPVQVAPLPSFASFSSRSTCTSPCSPVPPSSPPPSCHPWQRLNPRATSSVESRRLAPPRSQTCSDLSLRRAPTSAGSSRSSPRADQSSLRVRLPFVGSKRVTDASPVFVLALTSVNSRESLFAASWRRPSL